MSFESGRVSYCRFLAIAPGSEPTPATVDQEMLDKLWEFAFTEKSVCAPDVFEAGWTTGKHLFDTQFNFEKNVYGPSQNLLLFALRLDTHKVPGEVKKAYKTMNEQTMAAGNPSGFASRAQKKEAAELAERQVHEDLVAGRFRKSKIVPVLWDLSRRMVYVAASSNTISEHVSRLFRETFDVTLEPLSAGALAGLNLRGRGKGREYEDLSPSPFTKPPAAATQYRDTPGEEREVIRPDEIPPLPWIAKTIDDKDFLGNEFLMWLWFVLENEEGIITICEPFGVMDSGGDIAITLDKTLDMDCGWGAGGKQTLRGLGAVKLPEATKALVTGKWPRRAGLIIADTTDGEQWELVFQADRWLVSGAMLPEVADAENPRQIIEKRLESTLRLAWVMDGLFDAFLTLRVSSGWDAKRKAIRNWIETRGGGK